MDDIIEEDIHEEDNHGYMELRAGSNSYESQDGQSEMGQPGEVHFEDDSPIHKDCDNWFIEEEIETSKTGINACYDMTRQIFKIVVYILAFAIVLISAVVAKGTLFFMTSQIRPGKTTPYCDTLHGNLQSYQAVLSLQEQAQWIWVIFFAFLTPEFFTLLRSARLVTFKSFELPTLMEFSVVCLFETLHTVGIALLVFVVFPELNAVKGLMLTNCLCIVPGVLKALCRSHDKKGLLIIDGLAIVAQLSGLIVWPIIDYNNLRNAVWAIPVGIILTSSGWWENYIKENSTFDFIQKLYKIKDSLNESRTRYFVYAIVSLWKMLIFFCSMIGFVYLTATQEGQDGFFIFKYFITKNSTRPIEIQPTNVSNHIYLNPHLDGSTSEVVQSASDAESFSVKADGTAAISVWGIQIATAYACYIACKFACRIKIQGFSFAIPITLTVPTAISLMIVGCGMKNADVCYLKNVIPRYLYFECPSQEFFTNFIVDEYAWIWFFWFISQVWITFHIWLPRCERLASTEKIFLNPMYDGILVDQSVALNRRRDMEESGYKILNNQETAEDDDDSDNAVSEPRSEDEITQIKACITMWHESREEMLATLTSLMRLDLDQCKRKVYQEWFNTTDEDFYKLEGHIFMDDAIEHNDITCESKHNKFVKQLIDVMDEAAKIACVGLEIIPELNEPTKCKTPYGYRLIYKLLGGSKLYIHLKDVKLIRNRKRWSQVMYMNYLLGMKLASLDIPDDRKTEISKNTYILALDGDIEFQPEAVLLLVDLMKKNGKLGAACGRIHPVGSGLMAWYQKFEYAISHWLQKATEHVIGCVLCSPGCFSLFRGQALVEPNVVKTYTKRATEARHYVQYDQGEDRWLCTLLLQKGWRVEYAAAADAYTHCPESFNEFFNQRRRWVPSTMANIMDLLTSSKRTIRGNDDISIVYIIYQMVLMISAIIGPGTIFLMILGAMVSTFGIDVWTSMWLNIIPLLIFILVCFLCKQKTQLKIAAILTCIYALLMMAVLIGIFLEIAAEGWLAPSSFFLLLTAGLMIVTALLHPMEMNCLLYGVIYWVVIPSMYLLLIIYAIMNMNDVTWGVRETLAENTDQTEAKEGAAENKNKKDGIGNRTRKAFGISNEIEDDGEFCNIVCGNLLSLSCCTHQKTDPNNELAEKLAKLISDKLGRVPENEAVDQIRLPEEVGQSSPECEMKPPGLTENGRDPDAWREIPSWFTDELKGFKEELEFEEQLQWEDVIEKFLFPLTDAHENKKAIAKDLKGLRNQTAFAFLMINAMFVVTIFLMQLHQDIIYIAYPNIGHVDITWKQESDEVSIDHEMLRVEPIGLVLIIIFAGIMIIQFIAMLFHRFGTASLIMAITKITMCNKKEDKQAEKLHFFQQLTTDRELATGDNRPNNQPRHSRRLTGVRRPTFHDITMHNQRRRNTTANIEEVFRMRIASVNIGDFSDRQSIQNSPLNDEPGQYGNDETGSHHSDGTTQETQYLAAPQTDHTVNLDWGLEQQSETHL